VPPSGSVLTLDGLGLAAIGELVVASATAATVVEGAKAELSARLLAGPPNWVTGIPADGLVVSRVGAWVVVELRFAFEELAGTVAFRATLVAFAPNPLVTFEAALRPEAARAKPAPATALVLVAPVKRLLGLRKW